MAPGSGGLPGYIGVTAGSKVAKSGALAGKVEGSLMKDDVSDLSTLTDLQD